MRPDKSKIIVMKSVLVHVCCAHCAAYTVAYWRETSYKVSAFWYNPNIHPYTEHQYRLAAMKSLASEIVLPLTVAQGYGLAEYFCQVVGHEAERCRYCFQLRLSQTAETARRKGFNAFTTTLLISPHQKHELIREVGDAVAQEKGVAFLYADLRKRYSESRHMTKELNLYRQQYCGCLYSEWERYAEE